MTAAAMELQTLRNAGALATATARSSARTL